MTRVWRCVDQRFVANAFSGEGSRRVSGRWHSRGTPLVYASDSPALAVLEMALGLGTVRPLVDRHRVVPADLPEVVVEQVGELPERWFAFPHPPEAQEVGDRWQRARSGMALRVPSAVVPGWTFLLNPDHPDFGRLKVHLDEAQAIAPGRGRGSGSAG